MAYYGMFRVGKLASDLNTNHSNHAVKVKDVHLGQNKPKILIYLFTSKTHGKESVPQKIKMVSQREHVKTLHFCPFVLVSQFMKIRGSYDNMYEAFFVFGGKVPVTVSHVQQVLKVALVRVELDES